MIKNDQCQIAELKQEGSRVSWEMLCAEPPVVSGSSSVSFGGAPYTGDKQMQMQSDGQTMQMHQQYSGTHIGDCIK